MSLRTGQQKLSIKRIKNGQENRASMTMGQNQMVEYVKNWSSRREEKEWDRENFEEIQVDKFLKEIKNSNCTSYAQAMKPH